MLSRPAIGEILAWRQQVDEALERLLKSGDPEVLALAELGLHHEQQHQELLLMDILDGFSRQPLEPVYAANAELTTLLRGGGGEWLACEGGLVEVGHPGDGFHFDNETPRHRVWLEPFELKSQLVSNAEYRRFIADGGYQRPDLWMSEGWAMRQQQGWEAPRYWRGIGASETWQEEFTLAGRQQLNPDAPVRHLSWFEADAYARWAVRPRWNRSGKWPATARRWPGTEPSMPVAMDRQPYRPYPIPSRGRCRRRIQRKFMSSRPCFGQLLADSPRRTTAIAISSPTSRWMASGQDCATIRRNRLQRWS